MCFRDFFRLQKSRLLMIIYDEFVTLLYIHFKYHIFILGVGHGFVTAGVRN